MSGGVRHLCLDERAAAINVYDYGLGSGRFTLHMCCILHMIPAIPRDGIVRREFNRRELDVAQSFRKFNRINLYLLTELLSFKIALQDHSCFNIIFR